MSNLACACQIWHARYNSWFIDSCVECNELLVDNRFDFERWDEYSTEVDCDENISALYTLSGQDTNHDFFANELSNYVSLESNETLGSSLLFSFVTAKPTLVMPNAMQQQILPVLQKLMPCLLRRFTLFLQQKYKVSSIRLSTTPVMT